MATKLAEVPTPIVVGGKKTRVVHTIEAFHKPIALGLLSAGLIFMIGSIADLLVLWVFQRQPIPQWEFTAIATTAEGLPRIVLGAALIYAAMYVRGSTSLLTYRLLGLVLIGIGFSGIALGGLMALDFLALRGSVNPDAIWVFRSAVLKTLLLCGLNVILLIPAGVVSMRRPKSI